MYIGIAKVMGVQCSQWGKEPPQAIRALATARAWRESAGDALRRQAFPGADPVLADHVAGELESAVDRLLARIEQSLTPPAKPSQI